ncbi:MAG: hypothetical protein Q9190_001483 [Brigantiaea leucoxantha]
MSDFTVPNPNLTTDQARPPPAWYAAYPAPRSAIAPSIPQGEVLQLFRDGKVSSAEVILVDLRKDDFKVRGHDRSLNIPAQSMYHAIPALYALFNAAKVKQVIWYCGLFYPPSPTSLTIGSSRGRGNRAAGWFGDYVRDQGDERLQSLALEGGIKGWVGAGPEYVELIDGYEESIWKE